MAFVIFKNKCHAFNNIIFNFILFKLIDHLRFLKLSCMEGDIQSWLYLLNKI